MTQASPKKSDLPVRTASAIVMIAVAGTALWLGGWTFAGFAAAIGIGVYWEWWGLIRRIATNVLGQILWMVGGLAYIVQAVIALVALRQSGVEGALLVIAIVIAVDVGAYFAGRIIGGPKIAPSISPSKTWAGLAGGAIVAAAVVLVYIQVFSCRLGILGNCSSANVIHAAPRAMLVGGLFAIVAQSGDFFESWMKRRARVKDSGSLIPGHGGLYDRVDGLLAVLCFVALAYRFF